MAAFAARQRGNVSRKQLLAAGHSREAIDRRVRLGALHVSYPGIYLVGHCAEPPLAREAGALLCCRPRALLSHRTAARLWRLPVEAIDRIELTVVARHRRSPRGIHVYSLKSLGPGELRRFEGLPITSPSLTLLDVAGCTSERESAAALNEARVRELVDDNELQNTLRAHPNRRGCAALSRLLNRPDARFGTESEAERLCLKLMIAHHLEPDASGARIGPYRVDFLYEAERLIVEVDGYRFHRGKSRFVSDRRRRAELLARGYEVFPVTWSDLVQEPDVTMNRLRRTLEARRERPALRG